MEDSPVEIAMEFKSPGQLCYERHCQDLNIHHRKPWRDLDEVWHAYWEADASMRPLNRETEQALGGPAPAVPTEIPPVEMGEVPAVIKRSRHAAVRPPRGTRCTNALHGLKLSRKHTGRLVPGELYNFSATIPPKTFHPHAGNTFEFEHPESGKVQLRIEKYKDHRIGTTEWSAAQIQARAIMSVGPAIPAEPINLNTQEDKPKPEWRTDMEERVIEALKRRAIAAEHDLAVTKHRAAQLALVIQALNDVIVGLKAEHKIETDALYHEIGRLAATVLGGTKL